MQLAVFAAGTFEVTDYVISWTFPDLEGLHDTRPAPVLIVSVDDSSDDASAYEVQTGTSAGDSGNVEVSEHAGGNIVVSEASGAPPLVDLSS